MSSDTSCKLCHCSTTKFITGGHSHGWLLLNAEKIYVRKRLRALNNKRTTTNHPASVLYSFIHLYVFRDVSWLCIHRTFVRVAYLHLLGTHLSLSLLKVYMFSFNISVQAVYRWPVTKCKWFSVTITAWQQCTASSRLWRQLESLLIRMTIKHRVVLLTALFWLFFFNVRSSTLPPNTSV